MRPSVAPALAEASDSVLRTPSLRASWQRSHDLGVPLDVVEPSFSASYDGDSLLARCGTQVLTDLQSTLTDEPISLMVADRDGLVLRRLCSDAAMAATLDRVHLAPGFSYAERHAGTNGLGLSLVDRAPTLVRADEHWCSALRGYTCAAAPVIDLDGELVGTINLTTWSRSSPTLLLALAQSAATNTSTLMAVRSLGHAASALPPAADLDVSAARPGAEARVCASPLWRQARRDAGSAVAAGHLVAATGEAGSGKTLLLATAHRDVPACDRLLTARVPTADRVGEWLALWTAEASRPGTVVVVAGVDRLPAWAADELASIIDATHRPGRPRAIALTTRSYEAVPARLAEVIDAVVEVPPLRGRDGDIMALAQHFAMEERHRPVMFTAAATHALRRYGWPGNLRQLRRVVHLAAARTDVIDLRHLDPEVLTSSALHLSRIEAFERDELIRCLSAPGATVARAAAELGMSRATAYRKISQYGIRVPGRGEA